MHENYLRTYGEDFDKEFFELRRFWKGSLEKKLEGGNVFPDGCPANVHPFEVREAPKNQMDLLTAMLTGETSRLKATNWLYHDEVTAASRGSPIQPQGWDYRTNSRQPLPNWSLRKACNPKRCKVTGLQDRAIPTSWFSDVIEYQVKAHDFTRIPGTDDAPSQAVHLVRRGGTEMTILCEALNECMLTVSNIVSGLPEAEWFIPVLVRWQTIRAFLSDSVNGLQCAAKIHRGKLNCRSSKKFRELLDNRQVSLPLPTKFAQVDCSNFVPGKDFDFMIAGRGKFKAKDSKTVLDPKIELLAQNITPLKKPAL